MYVLTNWRMHISLSSLIPLTTFAASALFPLCFTTSGALKKRACLTTESVADEGGVRVFSEASGLKHRITVRSGGFFTPLYFIKKVEREGDEREN